MATPGRGDLIWITFTPQSGHDQAGNDGQGAADVEEKARLAVTNCPELAISIDEDK